MIQEVFLKTIHPKKLFNCDWIVYKKLKLTLFTNNKRGITTFNFLKKKGINIDEVFVAKKNLDKNILKQIKKKKT